MLEKVTDNFAKLYSKIGYTFQNPNLLESALTHRSYNSNNNERLEFLGDALLTFIIGTALFKLYPLAQEGELSRQRAGLVCGQALVKLAQQFQLGSYLRLGIGEIKSGGAERSSILADAMEAVIGAIYLDAGIESCEQCVLNWYKKRLLNCVTAISLKDPKTQLQEYLQARCLPLPRYKIIKIEGAAHEQIFLVECKVCSLKKTSIARGSNNRRAEQLAAEKILTMINEDI